MLVLVFSPKGETEAKELSYVRSLGKFTDLLSVCATILYLHVSNDLTPNIEDQCVLLCFCPFVLLEVFKHLDAPRSLASAGQTVYDMSYL